MKKYKNPEMRKATQQLKEAPRKIKIISGSASTREQLDTSRKRARSMTQSALPKTTKVSAKSKPTTAVRATKRGTPVPMPKKTASPKPKKPTLNDYLKQGKRPPIKPGLKLPSDADVIMKGYNDPATIKKYKKK
jgi:hypothetical protein